MSRNFQPFEIHLPVGIVAAFRAHDFISRLDSKTSHQPFINRHRNLTELISSTGTENCHAVHNGVGAGTQPSFQKVLMFRFGVKAGDFCRKFFRRDFISIFIEAINWLMCLHCVFVIIAKLHCFALKIKYAMSAYLSKQLLTTEIA